MQIQEFIARASIEIAARLITEYTREHLINLRIESPVAIQADNQNVFNDAVSCAQKLVDCLNYRWEDRTTCFFDDVHEQGKDIAASLDMIREELENIGSHICSLNNDN